MNRKAWDDYCEKGILALILGILIIGPLAFGGVGAAGFLVLQGLTLGVMVLWAARLWINPKPKLLFPPVCWAVVAFVLYAIGRYWTADIEYVARQELIRILIYAFLFFAILNNCHGQESTQVIAYTVVFVGMMVSAYAIFQFITGSDQVWNVLKPYPKRGSGTYICPNHTAGFLEMVLPLALTYALLARRRILLRIFLGYAAAVILAGIGVTISRGAWISTGLALLLLSLVLLRYRQYRWPMVVLLFLVVGSGILFVKHSFATQLRLKNLLTQKNTVEDDMRFAIWEPAVKIWKEDVWWGAGPGHFDARFNGYRPIGVQMRPERVHNDYLNTLADFGLVGAGLVLLAWALLGAGLARSWRFVRGSYTELGDQKGSNKFAIVLGATLGLVAILAHSFVDFNMHIPANAILVVTLMALISSHIRFATERYWWTAGVVTKLAMSALLIAGLVYLGTEGVRKGREYAALKAAAREAAYSPHQAKHLMRAFAIDPKNGNTARSIGEAFRMQAFEGGRNYRELTTNALQWFATGMELNRWNADNYLRYAMCLDWLGRSEEAAPYLTQAEACDPNSCWVTANIGVHYVRSGAFAEAKPWLERSLRLQWTDNILAKSYLEICNQRLLESATSQIRYAPASMAQPMAVPASLSP